MTKPTQAQIEALRKAQVLSWDSTWITGSTEKVIAALTAAAEAGDTWPVEDQIRAWLGRNATAETNPEKKAAFIEAHNAALKIIEEVVETDIMQQSVDVAQMDAVGRLGVAIKRIAFLEAKLTAAAEVGEQRACATCGAILADGPQPAFTYAAAAEVGEKEKHDAQVDRYVTLGNAMKMQTIERCAQVAENFPSTGSRSIAAAIRAMKDER